MPSITPTKTSAISILRSFAVSRRFDIKVMTNATKILPQKRIDAVMISA